MYIINESQIQTNPIVGNDKRTEVFQQREGNEEYEGRHNDGEGRYDNASGDKRAKRHKIELQGEFNKIKHLTFDGESKEVVEAWLINMNKYFQIYEYDHNMKARL